MFLVYVLVIVIVIVIVIVKICFLHIFGSNYTAPPLAVQYSDVGLYIYKTAISFPFRFNSHCNVYNCTYWVNGA